MTQGVGGGVVEHQPVIVIDVRFGGRAFGEQNIMAVEFDMKIGDIGDQVGLEDGDAVDQQIDRDQGAFDE